MAGSTGTRAKARRSGAVGGLEIMVTAAQAGLQFRPYRKKPVVIQAVRITTPMRVETLEGTMCGQPGDWLIIGVEGERYFCKDSIFRQTYELLTVGNELCRSVRSAAKRRAAKTSPRSDAKAVPKSRPPP